MFLLITFANFIFDIFVLIYLVVNKDNDNDVIVLILLACEGILSSMLYYIGTLILPFDIGKIILLKENKKVFGQIFGVITAFKYICDCVVI